MQRAAFAALGLRGWSYQHLPVPPELFVETVRALGAAGFVGANVTVPHKHVALALADSATPAARAIGAANTLSFLPDGTIDVDNTDAPGMLAAIETSVAGRSAVVLGAGGTARAATWALREAGASVAVWNRSPARAGAGPRPRRDRDHASAGRRSAREHDDRGHGRIYEPRRRAHDTGAGFRFVT
jgi:shikimate dehydrogenase